MVGKKVGDNQSGTFGLCPIYPGWEKSIAPWHNGWDAQRQAGENLNMERGSTEFSHIRVIATHTVAG